MVLTIHLHPSALTGRVIVNDSDPELACLRTQPWARGLQAFGLIIDETLTCAFNFYKYFLIYFLSLRDLNAQYEFSINLIFKNKCDAYPLYKKNTAKQAALSI